MKIIIRTDYLNNSKEQCVNLINSHEEFQNYVIKIAKEYDPYLIVLENEFVPTTVEPNTFLLFYQKNGNLIASLNKKISRRVPGYIYGIYVESIIEKICEWKTIDCSEDFL